MKYRDFLNKLSNEELAEVLLSDVLRHMCCDISVTNENRPNCPYNFEHCEECMVKMLESDIEDIDNFKK